MKGLIHNQRNEGCIRVGIIVGVSLAVNSERTNINKILNKLLMVSTRETKVVYRFKLYVKVSFEENERRIEETIQRPKQTLKQSV